MKRRFFYIKNDILFPGRCGAEICSDLQDEYCPGRDGNDVGGQCILNSTCAGNSNCRCAARFSCSEEIIPEERFEKETETESYQERGDCNASLCPDFKDRCKSKSGKCRLQHVCGETTGDGGGSCKCLVFSACMLEESNVVIEGSIKKASKLCKLIIPQN